MRQIRFRAWHKTKHYMTPSFPIWKVNLAEDPNASDWELMQFTGLLDKQGKEIYEGDIVGIKLTSKIASAIIEWNEREACFGCKWDEDTAKVRKEVGMPNLPANLICGGIGNPWEVIGNIYENKELLDEKPIN